LAGDTLVLEGSTTSNRGPVVVRETITRLSSTEFQAVWEALLDGVWTTYSVERVTRA
jgi:hypothetical protein